MTRHDCAQLAEDLVAYADGELEAARAAEVESELEACGVCRRELDALQRSWGALEALTAGDLQPASAARLDALEAQIRAAAGAGALLQPERSGKAGLVVRFPWLAPVAAAAAVLLCAGIGWSLFDRPTELTAVRPDRPAPTVPHTETPQVEIYQRPTTPEAPGPTGQGPRDAVPETPAPRPVAPTPPEEAPEAPEAPEVAPTPPQPAPAAEPADEAETGPALAEGGFEALNPEEQELVDNLELALLLEERGLDELSLDDLEAELLLDEVGEDLEGWDPDELEAG